MTPRESPYDLLCAHCGGLVARAGESPARCGCKPSEFWVTRQTYEIAGRGGNGGKIAEKLQANLRARQARAREEQESE